MQSPLSDLKPDAPVAVVIQTRISDDGAGPYVNWQSKVSRLLSERKGSLGQQVIAPSPPHQVDWVVIQRFATLADARLWMQAPELRKLLDEIRTYFVGHDDIYLRPDLQDTSMPATAMISCKVAPEDEEEFQHWERDAFEVESKAPGFVGHRLERPVEGIQPNWVIALSFDTDENLNAWIESPERAALLASGQPYQREVRIRKVSYGFNFWQRDADTGPPAPMFILKTNLLVLLVLYPIVYLWGYFVSNPFIDSKGVPFWLSLFIGNLFSTQLLGWWVVPWTFKKFDAWLAPKPAANKALVGWIVLILLYAVSLAVYAYILTLKPLKF